MRSALRVLALARQSVARRWGTRALTLSRSVREGRSWAQRLLRVEGPANLWPFMVRTRSLRLPGGRSLDFSLAEVTCHISFVLVGISYLERDVRLLRWLAIAGSVFSIAFQYFRPAPLWLPMRWNAVFVLINLVMIALLEFEEYAAAHLSLEEERVYRNTFAALGLSRVDFVHLLRDGGASWVQFQPGEHIKEEGVPSESLFLLVEGAVAVRIHGDLVAACSPGMFIGEMGLVKHLAGQPNQATATVQASVPVRCLRWSYAALDRLVKREPHLGHALRHSISADLMKKVEDLQGQSSGSNHYRHLLEGALLDGEVSGAEKRALRRFREEHQIPWATHLRFLHEFGWTHEEFEDGSRDPLATHERPRTVLPDEEATTTTTVKETAKESETGTVGELKSHGKTDGTEEQRRGRRGSRRLGWRGVEEKDGSGEEEAEEEGKDEADSHRASRTGTAHSPAGSSSRRLDVGGRGWPPLETERA